MRNANESRVKPICLVVASIAAACSAPAPHPSNLVDDFADAGAADRTDMCAAQIGDYAVRWTERPLGTCGPQDTEYIPVDNSVPVVLPANCSGGVTISLDRCTETTDVSCTFGPNLQRIRGTIRYQPDAQRGQGEWQLLVTQVADGQPVCSSVYDITTALN